MSKIKLSKAQKDVIKKISGGYRISGKSGVQSGVWYVGRIGERLSSPTVHKMIDLGLLEKVSISAYYFECKLTDLGRTIEL